MLHLIFNQIMSPVLAFIFLPHTLPKRFFKDTCLSFYNLENILSILLKFSPKNWCLPPGVSNGQAVLSGGHSLPKGERYLQTGTLALLGMNQWERVLSNSHLPQPTTAKPLAPSPPHGSFCSRE